MNSLINAVFFSFPTVFDVSTLEVVALPVTNFIRFLDLLLTESLITRFLSDLKMQTLHSVLVSMNPQF